MIKCKIGKIFVLTSNGSLKRIQLIGINSKLKYQEEGDSLRYEVERKIRRYLSGEVVDFSDIPLDYSGINLESIRVYEYLRSNLGYGRIITYKDLADIFNFHPKKVARIMAKNPFPIIIPCHRVVGKRNLGGYSFGIHWKLFLLRVEGII